MTQKILKNNRKTYVFIQKNLPLSNGENARQDQHERVYYRSPHRYERVNHTRGTRRTVSARRLRLMPFYGRYERRRLQDRFSGRHTLARRGISVGSICYDEQLFARHRDNRSAIERRIYRCSEKDRSHSHPTSHGYLQNTEGKRSPTQGYNECERI